MSILAIDWWRKRLWIAYSSRNNAIVFPIGSLDNNSDLFYTLAHIIVQHNISHIIVWCPSEPSAITKKIDTFVTQLKIFISPDIPIEKVNEDYTSVQAGERLWQFTKTAAEDTVAAVIMLETYLAMQQKSTLDT